MKKFYHLLVCLVVLTITTSCNFFMEQYPNFIYNGKTCNSYTYYYRNPQKNLQRGIVVDFRSGYQYSTMYKTYAIIQLQNSAYVFLDITINPEQLHIGDIVYL